MVATHMTQLPGTLIALYLQGWRPWQWWSSCLPSPCALSWSSSLWKRSRCSHTSAQKRLTCAHRKTAAPSRVWRRRSALHLVTPRSSTRVSTLYSSTGCHPTAPRSTCGCRESRHRRPPSAPTTILLVPGSIRSTSTSVSQRCIAASSPPPRQPKNKQLLPTTWSCCV